MTCRGRDAPSPSYAENVRFALFSQIYLLILQKHNWERGRPAPDKQLMHNWERGRLAPDKQLMHNWERGRPAPDKQSPDKQ